MQRFPLLTPLLLSILTFGVTVCKAIAPAGPAIKGHIGTPLASASTAAMGDCAVNSHPEWAPLFILGMSVLMLVPFGAELISPNSVGRALRLHHHIMNRRVQP